MVNLWKGRNYFSSSQVHHVYIGIDVAANQFGYVFTKLFGSYGKHPKMVSDIIFSIYSIFQETIRNNLRPKAN